MSRFVIFLRGINVGGHIVPKEKLLETLVSSRFRNVSTFKQSGNVILEADAMTSEEVKRLAVTKLRRTLNFDVAVFVRTIKQIQELMEFDPFNGQGGEGVDFQVTFLEKPLTEFPMKLPVRIPNSTADVISILGTEVFSVTRGHGDGGKPNPFLESKLKMRATTRNWNIIREIAKICS